VTGAVRYCGLTAATMDNGAKTATRAKTSGSDPRANKSETSIAQAAPPSVARNRSTDALKDAPTLDCITMTTVRTAQ